MSEVRHGGNSDGVGNTGSVRPGGHCRPCGSLLRPCIFKCRAGPGRAGHLLEGTEEDGAVRDGAAEHAGRVVCGEARHDVAGDEGVEQAGAALLGALDGSLHRELVPQRAAADGAEAGGAEAGDELEGDGGSYADAVGAGGEEGGKVQERVGAGDGEACPPGHFEGSRKERDQQQKVVDAAREDCRIAADVGLIRVVLP